jgi:hypothetical protein
MIRSHDRRPNRRLLATLTAASAAIATTALLATAGSAQTTPTPLHLVEKTQKGVGFAPARAPRQGDRLGFGSTISGDERGTSRTICTVIGTGRFSALCTIHVQLAHGTLAAQGLVGEKSNSSPVAITGGTGAYNGARGTALVTDVSASKRNITVTLVP